MKNASAALDVLRSAGMRVKSDAPVKALVLQSAHKPEAEEFVVKLTVFDSDRVKVFADGLEDTLHGTIRLVRALEDALELAKMAVEEHLPF